MEEQAPGSGVPDNFKAKGFESGETVFEVSSELSLEDVKEALFGSTYADPKTIRIEVHNGKVVFDVVIDTAIQKYHPHQDYIGDSPLGCWKYPGWYIEGWLLKSGFDPYSKTVRVRMYLDADSDGDYTEAYIQRIPKDPDPNGAIRLDG